MTYNLLWERTNSLNSFFFSFFFLFPKFMTEVKNWPYKFPASKDFLSSDQRGSVSGRLLVEDRYLIYMNSPF